MKLGCVKGCVTMHCCDRVVPGCEESVAGQCMHMYRCRTHILPRPAMFSICSPSSCQSTKHSTAECAMSVVLLAVWIAFVTTVSLAQIPYTFLKSKIPSPLVLDVKELAVASRTPANTGKVQTIHWNAVFPVLPYFLVCSRSKFCLIFCVPCHTCVCARTRKSVIGVGVTSANSSSPPPVWGNTNLLYSA